jgi:hypothetical protein
MYPVLLDLGWLQLRSYVVFVAFALVVGTGWAAREALRSHRWMPDGGDAGVRIISARIR